MAFSFTKTGFGGFGDPKPKTDKLVDFSSSRTVEKLKPGPGYITGGQKTTYTINKTFSNNNTYPGSDSFRREFSKARSSGLSTFNFGGRSYTTELKVPKTRTETSSITSITRGIKANPINITAPTLMKSPTPSTTTKIIPPPPPPPPKRRKRKKFKYTKVGKFIQSIGDIRLRPPNLRLRLGSNKKVCGCK